MFSFICVQRWFRSACAFKQSDQHLHCPLTEFLDITKCKNLEQRRGREFAHAQKTGIRTFCACTKALFRFAAHMLIHLYRDPYVHRKEVRTLRKHAFSNILNFSPPKNESFQIKDSNIFFHISAQNIDCGYSLEPP